MKVLTKTVSGTAHGKIILIGEHSVVHNEPAIAIPFTSVRVEVTIENTPGESTIESIYHTGKIADAPDALTNLVQTYYAVCEYFNAEANNMQITIKSDIPAERGMGSSAAVATALVRALFNYFERDLTDELLEEFVTISEKIAHGNPSGLDAKVVGSDQAVYFVRNQEPEFFDNQLEGFLVVADTGIQGETIHAVADVNKLVANKDSFGHKMISELGTLTKKARHFIENKELSSLGEVLSTAQARLQKLTVSNEKLDLLVDTALMNGAVGAKLTGGGRGGCMIALVEQADQASLLADTLLKVGATQTWIHPLGDQPL